MRVVLTEKALKDLKAIPKDVRKHIIAVIHRIRTNPLRYARKLSGYDLYRVRAGDYRIIIQLQEDKIIIIRVGHRKNVYKWLP
jgi:mRNA interferase RelE/StbE